MALAQPPCEKTQKTFAEIMKQWMLEGGKLSSRDVAGKVKISNTSINDYARGSATPRPETIRKIARGLNRSVKDTKDALLAAGYEEEAHQLATEVSELRAVYDPGVDGLDESDKEFLGHIGKVLVALDSQGRTAWKEKLRNDADTLAEFIKRIG